MKEFHLSVIADCGIFEYDDRKDYDTTELRNSYRKKKQKSVIEENDESEFKKIVN